MEMKRVLQGTAVAALAAAAWMGAGSTDASAKVTIDDVSFWAGYESGAMYGKLYVNAYDGEQSELMVGFPSVSKNKAVKITNWDVYDLDGINATDGDEDEEYGGIPIDLSKLKTTKDNYIALKQDDMDAPLIVKIEPGAKSIKVVFDAANAVIDSVKLDNGAEITDAEAMGKERIAGAVNEDYVYDKEKNDYVPVYEKLTFKEEQYQGSTQYVYSEGVQYDTYKKDDKGQEVLALTTEDLTDAKNSDKKYTCYTIGKMPSKVAKVKIAKQANAPSVTADYAKGVVKLSKGLEWRVIYKDENNAYTFQTETAYDESGKVTSSISPGAIQGSTGTTKSTSYNPADLLTQNGAKEGYIEVRKAATIGTTPAKNKCASKWNRVQIEKPKALAETAGTVTVTGVATDGTIVATGSAATPTASAVIAAKFDKNTKDKYVSLTLTNSSGSQFDIVYSDSEPAADKKVDAVLKANKTLKLTKAKVDGKTLWIRKSGDKKSTTWAGAYEKIGKVEFPSDPS